MGETDGSGLAGGPPAELTTSQMSDTWGSSPAASVRLLPFLLYSKVTTQTRTGFFASYKSSFQPFLSNLLNIPFSQPRSRGSANPEPDGSGGPAQPWHPP